LRSVSYFSILSFLLIRFVRFYGEAVVEACVEAGTHHLDISGEPAFLEKVQLKYHQKVGPLLNIIGRQNLPFGHGVRDLSFGGPVEVRYHRKVGISS